MFNDLTSDLIRTIPAADPYLVRLAGVPADDAVVWVHDDVPVDGYRIVRSAHTEGFWYVADCARAADEVSLALFHVDRTVSFSFPQR